MLRILALAMFFALLSAGSPRAQDGAAFADLPIRTIEHGGEQRSFGLYVPESYRADAPAPLIVVLHGRSSSPKAMHAISGLARVAQARGAILLYPATVGHLWADGGHEALRRRETAHDDLGFLSAAVEFVARDHAIDRAQIFLVGFDSGGDMAYRVACSDALPVAGVAIVSALMWDYTAARCSTPHPTSMLIVHGRRDEMAPPGGLDAPERARRYGVTETLRFWRGASGCGNATQTGDASSVYFASCSSGRALAYVGVGAGAHSWFRSDPRLRLNRHGIDSAALIERFFFAPDEFALPNSGGARGRAWIVYVPPNYNPAQPTPLVVVLHGRPSNAASMAAITQFNAVADRHGFIVAYPDGIDNQWATHFDLIGSDVRLGGMRSVAPQNDVEFLTNLADDLRLDFNIDPTRMYVTGFSNGGFMTLRMACSASDRFAAFAEVGAALYNEMTEICGRGRPAPLLLMHGSVDPSIPYGGVTVRNPEGGDPLRVTLSVQNTVAFFINRNGCSLAGESATLRELGQSPGTHVIRFTPRGCPDNAQIVFYLVNGGGHTWPGVRNLPDSLGPTNMDINASEVIWDFFSRQRLPEQR
jgi:polyhydroxybutyrate depolymerase